MVSSHSCDQRSAYEFVLFLLEPSLCSGLTLLDHQLLRSDLASDHGTIALSVFVYPEPP